MRDPCTVIVLPIVRIEAYGDDAEPPRMPPAVQRLLPSSDRRNVVELWRVRLEREQAGLLEQPPGETPDA